MIRLFDLAFGNLFSSARQLVLNEFFANRALGDALLAQHLPAKVLYSINVVLHYCSSVISIAKTCQYSHLVFPLPIFLTNGVLITSSLGVNLLRVADLSQGKIPKLPTAKVILGALSELENELY